MRVSCTVDGERRVADDVWAGESLLYVLRERPRPAGQQERVRAGRVRVVFTVVINSVTVCACLVAAGQAQDRDVQARGGPRPPTGAIEGAVLEGPAAPACIPCSRRLSRPGRCSAAFAPRD